MSGVFCLMFALDIVHRIAYDGRAFLLGAEWGWNSFDLLLVVIMCVDLFLRYAGFTLQRGLTAVRVLRLTRIGSFTRLARLVYALESFHDFRILLISIRTGMPALLWVLLVSFSFVFMFALGLADETIGLCNGDYNYYYHGEPKICSSFGTLPRSLGSLFLAMYDGIAWGELLESLPPQRIMVKVVFIVQMIFLKIIVVNLFLAVLIGMTQRIQQREAVVLLANANDERARQLAILKELFESLDMNNSGAISLDELEMAFEDPKIMHVFAQLKIDTHDVYSLFEILDEGGQHAIDFDSFIVGMKAIAGDARGVDVVKVQKQCSTILRIIQDMGAAGSALPLPLPDSGDVHGPPAPFAPVAAQGSATLVASQWRERFASSHVKPLPQIRQVELRAMTLVELRQVRALIGHLCLPEQWVDPFTGKVLSPEKVNLYHFTSNFIYPKTAPVGVIMHIPGCTVDRAGAVVRQFDDIGRCMAEGELVGMTEAGHKVRLTRGLFMRERMRLLVDEADFAQPTRIETPGSISYKELVSSEPTRPVWFCSHWWGEVVYDFVDVCEKHARLRRMDESSATYWICGYANRQHSLESEIGGELEQTSFFRAMQASEGTLLVLDENAIVFTRIWCDFEIFCTVSGGSRAFDIATNHDGVTQLLSTTALPKEPPRKRSLREQKFPAALLVKGMYLRLQDGEATLAADKEAILRYISQSGPRGCGVEDSLRNANAVLHALFARSAWPQAVRREMVDNFDPDHPGALKLPDILRQDIQRQILNLSLEHIDQVTDAEVAKLASGLPANLVELKLSFEGCQHVTSEGVAAIAAGLPTQIQALKLDFLGCIHVDDIGLVALAAHLPAGLLKLEVHFDGCHKITAGGVHVLAEKMPRHVKEFQGTFRSTGVDRNFSTVREFRGFMRSGIW